MDCLQARLVRLVNEVDHPNRVIVLNQVHVGCRAGPDLHLQADSVELDSLDYLVQLKVPHEQIITLPDVADITR